MTETPLPSIQPLPLSQKGIERFVERGGGVDRVVVDVGLAAGGGNLAGKRPDRLRVVLLDLKR